MLATRKSQFIRVDSIPSLMNSMC